MEPYFYYKKEGFALEYEIYILATQSKTCFSRLIHAATSAPFTHISIGMSGLHGDFYSFGRRYRRLMLPAGFVKEEIGRGGRREIRYRMYRLQVTRESYLRIQERLRTMYGQRKLYHYNLLGALTSYFHFPLERSSHYFCSQFVAETLQSCGALEFDKNAALVYPMDFCGNAKLHLVSEGMIGRFGTEKALPAPSEAVAVLPFGDLLVRAYRNWSRRR